ncbi:hypothetical protein PVAND_003645 [Polypedilum vanderplanki]|uniref:UDP-glucuronosyltransferase n=1 Tax=Polypedilum vanderplanki TaxID=319348 RepID=A0A9J6BV79_POLVA|nr:hypothetical protein PVAND_003645 [Polypedilum vanderplanki]
MKFLKYLIYFLGLFFVNSTNGLNILAIFPLSMKSHYAIGFSIVKSLLDVGHNVTAISTLKPDKQIENYQIISIPDVMEEFKEQEPNPFEFIHMPIIMSMLMMPKFGIDMVNSVMKSEELHMFLKSNDKFDICIMELFGDEALLGIPEKFDCILLLYMTFDSFVWSDNIVGNQSPGSYVPNPYLHYTDKMTYMERVWNEFVNLFDKTLYYGYHLPRQRELYNKYFPNAKRTFDEMYRNSSIIFINNHVSHSFPRPHQPTQIEIGGIHQTDGAILFSMGSYIDGTDWPLEKRDAFIKVFGKLKQKVIWRYSNETLP